MRREWLQGKAVDAFPERGWRRHLLRQVDAAIEICTKAAKMDQGTVDTDRDKCSTELSSLLELARRLDDCFGSCRQTAEFKIAESSDQAAQQDKRTSRN